MNNPKTKEELEALDKKALISEILRYQNMVNSDAITSMYYSLNYQLGQLAAQARGLQLDISDKDDKAVDRLVSMAEKSDKIAKGIESLESKLDSTKLEQIKELHKKEQGKFADRV